METLEQLDSLTEQALEQRDYQKAQEYAWQQLDRDNLREWAVRQLMTALARSGQRSAAMAQYEIYRRRLEEASANEPSPELTELYQRIQNDELQQTMLRHPAKHSPEGEINPIFCYTDIESSTRLWDEHREAMLGALRQHNDLCETEIERYDGRILHPTGDGFLIVFEQNDPLAFAISLQQQFAQTDWGEIGELRIRIGLHGATADQEGHEYFHDDGGWYRGPVLNHAARIADTGHGGQIVASDMVFEYCPLPSGASWEDLGAHNLKSLEEAYHINGLLHPDLAMQAFPALRTPANKKKAQVGSHIRGYELGSMIGQGAFGEVYHAQQPGVGRPVAVKKIRSRFANQPEFIRRFEAEAQVIARLEHPHIVPLYDYWREADGAFLVMRFMRGGSLKGLLESGALDLETTLSLVDQVGSALAFSHQQGFVHRDIKPANILLDETGNGYLSDFGIVKDLSMEEDEAPSDSVTGTPAYLSPEQALSKDVSPRSDQYSLGVMLYEVLTGAKPFDDTTSPSALLAKQVEEPLPLVSTTHPAVPPAVDEVIQRSTAKDAAARYENIPAMIRALHQAAQKDGKGFALPADFVELEDELVNPYKGLRSFQEADAVNFFGRRALVEQLLTRFSTETESIDSPTDRFLAVVGPSGSGKSSVVKAGLLPALRRGGVSGSEKWFMVEMIPGLHPLEELEAALLRIAIDTPESLAEQLRTDEQGLARVLEQILPDDGSELLLMVDQFEELFTLVEDEEQRRHFINSLLAALHAPNSRLRVVITVRADFYDRPLMIPGLADLMRQCTEIVPPLNRSELEEVIVQPALQVGAIFEDGLVPTIIDDVSEQPGALPLLQYALTELFERRQERLITRAAYDEIGGVLGALGRRAEELYAELDDEGEEAARQLFMRLVTLGEGTEDTRRRVLRSELTGIGTAVVMTPVIDAYGRNRLLTFDHDPLTREPTVEVAHEALLREWERLRVWLDDSRDDVRLQRSLAAFAAEWAENNRGEGFLLRDSRLDLLAGWAAATTLALTPHEQDFLQASTVSREKRRLLEQDRQQRELETAQQLAREQTQRAEEQKSAAAGFRRRAYILGGVLVLAVFLAVAAFFFAQQSGQNAAEAEQNAAVAATSEAEAVTEAAQRATAQAQAEIESQRADAERDSALSAQATAVAEGVRADEQRDAALAAGVVADEARAEAVGEREIAEQQTLLTTSRELALAALTTLENDPELSVLLALEALAVTHTQEAEEALHRAIPASRTRQVIGPSPEVLGRLAITPDGQRLVTMETPYPVGVGVTKVWDAETGEELLTLQSHNDGSGGLAVSPDGKRVATVSDGDTVRVWDIETGEVLLRINGDDGQEAAVAFSPDGTLLATGGEEGLLKLWDLESGSEILSIAAHSNWIGSIEFSPDGSRLFSGSDDGSAKIWDAVSGQELLAFSADFGNFDQVYYVPGIAFSPDGTLAAAVNSDGMLAVWDSVSGEELLNQDVHTAEGRDVAFSPDGSQLATAGADGKAKLWDLDSGDELLTLTGHDDRVFRVKFMPDGTQLVTSSADGTARIWDIGPSHELLTFEHDGATRVKISPDGSRIVAGSYFGPTWIWDAESGALLQTLEGHSDFVYALEFSPAGDLIATGSEDMTGKIWDVETGEELMAISGHEDTVNDVAFSPDGTQLASSSWDGIVNIWDVSSGLPLTTFDVTTEDDISLMGIDYSPDGELLAIGVNNIIELWNRDGSELLSILEGHDDRVRTIIFSPDGTKVAALSWNGIVKIWDLDTNEELLHIEAHNGKIESLVFNSDWSNLATTAGDATIKYWDASTGELLLLLTGHTDAVFGLDFSPDGKSLISASSDFTIREWVLDLEDLIALGEARVTRSLKTEECRQYLHLDACPVEE